MNFNISKYGTVTNNDDGTISVSYISLNDPRGFYDFSFLPPGSHLYCYVNNTETMIQMLGVYEIISINGLTSSKIKNVILKRINDSGMDDNSLSVPAILCSCENYIDDVPSGDTFIIENELIEQARTYNLTHQPKAFIDSIKVEEITTDTTIEDVQKRHYIELQHRPTTEAVQIEINGVSYYENDDFIVDRANKLIYFDTSEDDFSFDNLKESTDRIRAFYKTLE